MANQHGKDTVVLVDANDLSEFANASELSEPYDVHDVTTYGKATVSGAHHFDGGLSNARFTMSGIYDNTASGPRAVLKPLRGLKATITRRPEGTGAGLPQDLFEAVLNSYVETSPTADMVAWSTEWTVDGAVDITAQV